MGTRYQARALVQSKEFRQREGDGGAGAVGWNDNVFLTSEHCTFAKGDGAGMCFAELPQSRQNDQIV